MPAPPTTLFAQDAYNRLEPIWAGDDQRGWPLLTFIAGLGEAFRQGEEIARAQPGRQPYQQAWDIDRCPDWNLPFLGQAVGVTVSPSDPPDIQRAQIRAEGGFARGRPSTLQAIVAKTLTGLQRVNVTERYSDAWTIDVQTYTAETPAPAATGRAAAAATVAGLVLTIGTRDIPLVDDMSRTIDALAGTIDTFTFADVT